MRRGTHVDGILALSRISGCASTCVGARAWACGRVRGGAVLARKQGRRRSWGNAGVRETEAWSRMTREQPGHARAKMTVWNEVELS